MSGALILANVVALGLLYWFLKDIDWAEMRVDLGNLHWGWVAFAVITDVLVYMIHALRWKMLLRPLERISYWSFLKAIYAGLFANEVLPLRTGEVIRCFMITRWSKLPLSVTLSSFVVERVMDGIWLLICLVVSLNLMSLPNWARQGGWLLAGVIVVLAIPLAVAAFARDRVRPYFSKNKILRHALVVVDDLSIIGHSRYLYIAFFLSLPYILAQVLPIYGLAVAYGLDPQLTLVNSFVLMVVLRLSAAVPQAPGNLGVYQQLAKSIVMRMGVERGLAGRFALVLWTVVTVPLMIAGFVAVVASGANLLTLHKEAEAQITGNGRQVAPGTTPS